MDLLLVRHALPIRIEGADGAADPDLSDHGHRQADAIATWLADEGVDAVYTSPLNRAVQTATPLAERLGLTAIVEDGLAEIDRDASWYVPLEELRAEDDPRYLEIVAGEWEADLETFQQGVVTGVERVIADNPGRTVVAFCHGGVINAYLSNLLEIERLMFFEPTYTSVSRIRAASSGPRSLVSLNETAHLRDVGISPVP